MIAALPHLLAGAALAAACLTLAHHARALPRIVRAIMDDIDKEHGE